MAGQVEAVGREVIQVRPGDEVSGEAKKRQPLSETAEALRYLEEGRARGKVVITVPGAAN